MVGPTLEEVRREMAAIKEGSEMDRLKAALAKLWKERAEAQREALPPARDGET